MQPLRRKQSMTNDAWIEVVNNIGSIISKAELDQAVAGILAEIQKTAKGKKTAFSWSAGKDSIVLSHLCEQAGIKDCVIAVCNLEYPAFLSWIMENKPEACEVINTGQDMAWLSKHPDMVFPQDNTRWARWFSIVQHRAQTQYFKKHNLDMLLLGRRRADGNYVGGPTATYTNGKGVTYYSPMAAWKHEYVLAYIFYHKLPLPPIYDWKNGYLCGTHPWPARQWTGSIENGWREVYDIDRSIVENAAEHIDSARSFMEGLR